MNALTPRQRGELQRQRIVDFICAYTRENGFAPVIDEIREGLDISSKSVVHAHLYKLKKQGRVSWIAKAARTLKVLEQVS